MKLPWSNDLFVLEVDGLDGTQLRVCPTDDREGYLEVETLSEVDPSGNEANDPGAVRLGIAAIVGLIAALQGWVEYQEGLAAKQDNGP